MVRYHSFSVFDGKSCMQAELEKRSQGIGKNVCVSFSSLSLSLSPSVLVLMMLFKCKFLQVPKKDFPVPGSLWDTGTLFRISTQARAVSPSPLIILGRIQFCVVYLLFRPDDATLLTDHKEAVCLCFDSPRLQNYLKSMVSVLCPGFLTI